MRLAINNLLLSRHNISTEEQCLTLNVAHTNALLIVSPVNYRILPNLINTWAWITRP